MILYDLFIYSTSILFIIFALLFSPSYSRNSDPGSHGRFFSPPTHYGSCLAFFIARRFQLFLPSPTRVESRSTLYMRMRMINIGQMAIYGQMICLSYCALAVFKDVVQEPLHVRLQELARAVRIL